MSRARLLALSFELDRVARAVAVAREELAFRFLSEDGWLELSRILYGKSTKYLDGSTHNESGLFEFERDCIEQFFPAAPASILVGACGGGRELFGLLARGDRVAAANALTAEAQQAGYKVRAFREHDFSYAHAVLFPDSAVSA